MKSPRLLLLDNHDSFTWNLSHYFEELGAEVEVRLSDQVDVPWVLDRGYQAVVVSPGPGRPEDSGITPELIRAVAGRMPLLGVCLGHQAIAQVFGGLLVRADVLMHGKTSLVHHDGHGLFEGLSQPFRAMRYHSLVVDPATIGGGLVVTAKAEGGVVMGLSHRELGLHGVQFHPESIMTAEGKHLLRNFLGIVRDWRRGKTRLRSGATAPRVLANLSRKC